MAIKTEDLSNTFHGYSELVGADKLLQAIIDLGATEVTPRSLEAILARFCKFKFSEIHGTSQASEYSTVFEQRRKIREHNERQEKEVVNDGGSVGYGYCPDKTVKALRHAVRDIEDTLEGQLKKLLAEYPQISNIAVVDKTLADSANGVNFVTPQIFITVEI